MSTTKPIRRVTIIGTGVIGASWATLYLAKGLEVVATDIAPNAEAALKRFVDAAWPALKRLGLAPGASQSKLSFTPKVEAAVSGADLVQENGPERLDFKQKLYGQLDDLLPPEVIIASSSSGLTMSEIQLGLPLPSRALRNRPSLQSSPSRPTGRNRGRRQDLRRDHSARRGILQQHWKADGSSAQGDAGARRQSSASRPFSGSLLSCCRRRRQRRRCGHRIVLGTGPALGPHGQHASQSLGRR